jgi:hypothetical protein
MEELYSTEIDLRSLFQNFCIIDFDNNISHLYVTHKISWIMIYKSITNHLSNQRFLNLFCLIFNLKESSYVRIKNLIILTHITLFY